MAYDWKGSGADNLEAFLKGIQDERRTTNRRLITADLAIIAGLAAGPVYRKFVKPKKTK